MRPINPFRQPVPWLLAIALQTLLLLCLTLPLRSAHALTLDEVGAGELLFKNGNDWQPSIQLGTRVDIKVTGMVARVTIEQRFRNPNADWAEGSYVFPLPETAAVAEMRITVDDRMIVGEIREKEAAEQIYQQAKTAGKRAALLDQKTPNLFRTRVANLGPGQEISVELVYLEKVTYQRGEFSLRFPMTITARFDPFQAERAQGEMPALDPTAEPYFRDPGLPRNPVQITAQIDAGIPLATVVSPYHPVHVETVRDAQSSYRVALANNVVPMDHDFVLRWRPAPSAVPQASLFAEELDGDTYALLMVMPPERKPDMRRLDRELVFVVDTSGSMGGGSIRAARKAMQMALRSLAPTDRFNVITFSDQAENLFPEAQLAAGSYLQDAKDYISRIEAGNGTNMDAALRAALDRQRPLPAGTVRQVILLTDGGVWGSDALFRYIDAKHGESKLFTVGIGSAPNNHFMRKAAQYGGGSFTNIANHDEANAVMAELFATLSAPQLSGLQVEWSGKNETFPQRIPDLYAGEPLVVTARIDGTARPLTATVRDASGQWQQRLTLTRTSSENGVSTLWARDKLEALYDRITENGESSRARDAIVEVGLRHKLVSRYTSFVAVEKTPVRPAGSDLNSSRVPNSLPAGQVLALPQTDAGTFMKLLLGILSLLLAKIVMQARSHAA